jgi:drug/metabolite transporter (DMT)-like permease
VALSVIPRHSMALSANTRGIIATCIAMAGFVTNDTCIKLAASDLPIPQLIAMRGVAALLFIVMLGFATGTIRTMPKLTDKAVGLRAVGEVGGTLLYYNALTQIPIANANAVLQVIPLVVTAVAAIVLGEQVGWRRWIIVLIGFAGVMLVIQPGGNGFHPASLWALGAMCFMVLRDLSTRFIDPKLPTISINIITTAAVMLVGFGLAAFEPWQMPSARSFVLMGLSAVLLTIAYLAITVAMRSGDVSVSSPFRYSIVLWALLIDLVVFGNRPELSMMIGMTLVVGSGITMIFRERQLTRASAQTAPDHDHIV